MNQNTTLEFQPSLMEKLLGKWYKWWYIILYNYKRQINYRADAFLFALSQVIVLVIILIIWQIRGGSESLNIRELITYTLIANLYTLLTPCWQAQSLSDKINKGSLSTDLLRPTQYIWVSFFEFIGRGILVNMPVIILPTIVLIPFFGQYLLSPSSVINLVIFLTFIPLTYFLRFFFETLFGLLTFWLIGNTGLLSFKEPFRLFLSGLYIPLNLISIYLIFQPLAWLAYHPMQIYLGKYDLNQTILVFLGGIIWCIALYLLAKLVFKLGLKRNESVGL